MSPPIQYQVMLIDDEPRNLDVLADILEQESWAVSAFPNGGAALNAATENPPDLVLLDVRMPGMNGTISVRCHPDAGIALHIELPQAHPDASEQMDFSPDYNPKETLR